MTPPDPERGVRGRFPALEPEEVHDPWRRRLAALVVLAAAVIVAVVVLGPRLTTDGHEPKSAGVRAPLVVAGGRIVAETSAGGIALANPNGGSRMMVPGVALAPTASPVASSDGRLVALGGSGLLSFDGIGGAAVRSSLPSTLPSEATVVAFADRSQAVVVVSRAGFGDPTPSGSVSVVPLGDHGGRPVSLGAGDRVSGDPSALGAFVSVALSGPAEGGAEQILPDRRVEHLFPDSRIELRDAGEHPLVLATAAQLNSDLGQDPALPVSLQVVPDPTGARLAVAVIPADGSDSDTVGVVVLDRAGHVVGTVSAAVGPSHGAPPTWSPDGRSLVYPDLGNTGPGLAVWTVGGPVNTWAAPASSNNLGGCVWSPDGSTVLCPSYLPSGSVRTWVILGVRRGTLLSVAGDGVPVAWVAASGRQRDHPAPSNASPA